MPTKATVKLISLRNCLVNLPLTLYSQLSEKGIPPQNLVVELSWQASEKQKLSLGWTGMPARIIGLRSARVQGTFIENIELDAQFAKQVHLTEGQQISIDLRMATPVASSVSISPISADDWEILVCCFSLDACEFGSCMNLVGSQRRLCGTASLVSSPSCNYWPEHLRLDRPKQDYDALHCRFCFA